MKFLKVMKGNSLFIDIIKVLVTIYVGTHGYFDLFAQIFRIFAHFLVKYLIIVQYNNT